MSASENKVAIITGSSRGIGRAIAIELAAHGCNVVVNYCNSPDAAEEVVNEIKALGSDAIAVKANVRYPDDVDNLFKQSMEKFGKLDVLVNNAGITKDTLMMRMKHDQWQDVVDLNLTGVFMCTQTALKHMLKKRSGRIVNIASVVGMIGNAGQANYSASKAGVIGLTMSAAKESATRGITVNAVAPGFISSDMTAKLPIEAMEQLIPMKRFGEPSEVAGLVRYLALDSSSSYITGHTFSVDGGISIGV